MRARLLLVAVLLLAAACACEARPEMGRLIELDDAQLCFQTLAPAWWNALSDASVAATHAAVGSRAHVDNLGRRVARFTAALRAGRAVAAVAAADVAGAAPVDVPALLACTRVAHRTSLVATLFSQQEERAASMQSA